jgi:hypothetical protein
VREAGPLRRRSTPSTGLRRPLRLAAILALALVAWALAANPASAKYTHPSVAAEFGPDGTSATSFGGSIYTLVYQQSAHKLFVLDRGNTSSVSGFSHPSPGTFTPLGGAFPFTVSLNGGDPDLALDNSASGTAGDLYLAPDASAFGSYDSSGAPLATSYEGGGEICGLAVDNTGKIWAGRFSGGGRLVEFTPGVPTGVRTLDVSTGASNICKLGIDQSNNDIYASSYGGSGVWRYTAASGYATAEKIQGVIGNNNRIAINGAKHVLYVGGPESEGKILAFSTTTGALQDTMEPPGGSIQGIAVDEATDTLFVAQGGSNKVLEMPGIVAPKASTDEPGGNFTVSGMADPDGAGPITKCYFEFGPTTAYGSKQDCAQSLPINSATAVTAALPGLSFEATYHYRLVVGTATAGAIAKGADRAIFLRHVKGIQTEAASAVNRTTARLNASFEGTGEATSYYFEYGASTDYGSRFPAAPNEEVAAAATGPVPISVPISGLSPETTYYFRVVAKNGQGVSVADGNSFRTPPAVNAVVAEAPTDVSKTMATLNGSYDGATNDTPPGPLESFHYYFEWGPAGSYGHTTAVPPGESGGAHAETVHVSAPITGLSVGSAYHYRLVVSNSVGTTYGPDMGFSTLPPDPPQVRNVRADGVLPTGAILAASVNPGGLSAAVSFEYGTTVGYGTSTSIQSLLGSLSDQPVSAVLDHLVPGTVYHYRVHASSTSGATDSPDQTFTTPSVPVIESSDPQAGVSSAHLTASVSPSSSPTQVRFEYGGGSSYGSATAPVDIGSGQAPRVVGADLSGLRPGTTYHFRVVATNGVGSSSGPDQIFTTLSAPPATKARPKPCKRGFVKHKGKCVKKHKKHKKHAAHKK